MSSSWRISARPGLGRSDLWRRSSAPSIVRGGRFICIPISSHVEPRKRTVWPLVRKILLLSSCGRLHDSTAGVRKRDGHLAGGVHVWFSLVSAQASGDHHFIISGLSKRRRIRPRSGPWRRSFKRVICRFPVCSRPLRFPVLNNAAFFMSAACIGRKRRSSHDSQVVRCTALRVGWVASPRIGMDSFYICDTRCAQRGFRTCLVYNLCS